MKKLAAIGAALSLLALQVPAASALTVPTLTVDESNILRTFLRVGAQNSTTVDGDTLASTAFDYRAFLSHECYNPIGEIERERCRQQFGSLSNLSDVLQSGMLFDILLRNVLLETPDFEQVIDTSVALPRSGEVLRFGTTGTRTTSDSDASATRRRTRTRSQTLWEVCAERFGPDNQNACYQQNIRLVRDTSLSVEGNVYFSTGR